MVVVGILYYISYIVSSIPYNMLHASAETTISYLYLLSGFRIDMSPSRCYNLGNN